MNLPAGTAWACSLLSELVGHFHKRSLEGMAYVDPAKLDLEALMGLGLMALGGSVLVADRRRRRLA